MCVCVRYILPVLHPYRLHTEKRQTLCLDPSKSPELCNWFLSVCAWNGNRSFENLLQYLKLKVFRSRIVRIRGSVCWKPKNGRVFSMEIGCIVCKIDIQRFLSFWLVYLAERNHGQMQWENIKHLIIPSNLSTGANLLGQSIYFMFTNFIHLLLHWFPCIYIHLYT